MNPQGVCSSISCTLPLSLASPSYPCMSVDVPTSFDNLRRLERELVGDRRTRRLDPSWRGYRVF